MVRVEAGPSVPASRKASEVTQGEQRAADWGRKTDSGAALHLHIPAQPKENEAFTARLQNMTGGTQRWGKFTSWL